jgi:hypothetical protein
MRTKVNPKSIYNPGQVLASRSFCELCESEKLCTEKFSMTVCLSCDAEMLPGH